MSKICPSCEREIDENLAFCNFCGAFAGNPPVKESAEKVVTPKNIIIASAALILLVGIMLVVFVFDIFGMKSHDNEIYIGRGKPLFSMGLTPVALNGNWGYADKEGNIVIAPTYNSALPFADKVNGLALVTDGNSKMGYIDEKGEYKISPTFTDAGSFSLSGYARVQGKNFINGAGRKLLTEDYSFVSDFTDSGYALAINYGFDKTENRYFIKDGYYQSSYHIIDKNGGVVIGVRDKGGMGIAELFEERYVVFRYKRDQEYNMLSEKEFALADYESGAVTDTFYDRIYKSNDFYILCTYDEESCLYKAEIYDKDINKLKDGYYTDSSFTSCDSGFVLYKKTDNRYVRVLLNDDLEEICCENANVRIIRGFDKSGIACVKEGNRYIGYNADGKVFESEYPFGKMNCGLAPFLNSDGRIGYINIKGEVVLKAEYVAVSEFSADGYATVFSEGSYKIIDTTGKIIVDGLFDAINRTYKNGLDLSWYGNESFDDGIKLMFEDDVLSGASEGFYNGRSNVFERDGDYRLYNKNGELLSGEKDIISAYDSGYGGTIAAQLVTGNEKFQYTLITSDGAVKTFADIPVPAADEYGIISGRLYKNTSGDSDYGITKNNGTDDIDTYELVKEDKGFYLTLSDDYYIEIYDKDMRILAVLPCDRYTDISGGKLSVGAMSQNVDKWLNVKDDVMSDRASASDSVYDYYTGRCVLKSNANISFTQNGFMFVGSSVVTFYSPDGLHLYRNNDATGRLTIADDSYPDVLLFKNGMDGTYMFIDRFGNRSEKYEYASGFGADGYATVRKSDGKYYCIDIYFNELFSSDNQFMGFNNGLAPFYDGKSGFIGYMDKEGKTVIEPVFHAVSDFSYDGYAVAWDEYGNAFIIDKKGDTVIATDGFENAESVKYINDSELGLYSRYTYENGYKYYLTLDWETEKDKLFRYGLAAVEKGGGSNVSYLSDVYGNIVFGPVYTTVSDIQMLPDGTPCFAAGGVYYALDGKPIEYLEDYSDIRILSDSLIYADEIILGKNGEPIFEEGVVCRNTDMYGYFSMKNTNTGESFTIDENGDIVDTDRYRIDERYLAFIEGNDLVTVYSGNSGQYETLISISTGETLFEGQFGEDLSWLVIGDEKSSIIELREKDVWKIYTYSKEKGLVLLIDNLAAISPDEDKIYGYPGAINREGRTAWFDVQYDLTYATHDGSSGYYDMIVIDLEANTYSIVEDFRYNDVTLLGDRPVWLGYDARRTKSYVLSAELKKEEFVYDVLSPVSEEYYNGYRICIDAFKSRYFYVREDGKQLRDFYECTPFRPDGFAKVRYADSENYFIIDRSGNRLY